MSQALLKARNMLAFIAGGWALRFFSDSVNDKLPLLL